MAKLIIANWKSYVGSEKEAVALAQAYGRMAIPARVEVAACPPSVYLETVKGKMGQVKLGAQNVSLENEGAYTGAITAQMLQDTGVEYVIVGHSERRAEHETNEEVNKKVAYALNAGFKVILCVGELEAVRRKGVEAALEFVNNELAESVPEGIEDKIENLIVAYEPIWAISRAGEGRTDTSENAAAMIGIIKSFLVRKFPTAKPFVLYGGSLNGKNAAAFLSKPEINGGLVGYASTDAEEFKKIIDAAA